MPLGNLEVSREMLGAAVVGEDLELGELKLDAS
jgi:hypothetical protein